jgi:hypothetical protein
MEAGISSKLWSLEDIVALLDANVAAPKTTWTVPGADPKFRLTYYPPEAIGALTAILG